jgi:DNA-directed RNA polymerase specialized sigma subunit
MKAGSFLKLGRKQHKDRLAAEREHFPDYGTPREPDPKRERPGVPSNLPKYRFRGKRYTEGELADEIRLAQSGDKAAADRVIKHVQPLVGRIIRGPKKKKGRRLSTEDKKRLSRKRKYYGLSYEEMIAIANLGAAYALLRFDLRKNASFTTYLEHCIHGALLDSMKGTTAPERALFANPWIRTAPELAAASGLSFASPAKIAKALELAEDALAKREGQKVKNVLSYDDALEQHEFEPSDGGFDRKQQIDPRHYIHAFDKFDKLRTLQHADIGRVINLAVALSDGRVKQLLQQHGRRIAAQILVEAENEKNARGTYIEVKRRRRMREISPLQTRAWREAAESDALEHGKRQLPLQRSRQDREEHEKIIRKQKNDAMNRAVAIAIEDYLMTRRETL